MKGKIRTEMVVTIALPFMILTGEGHNQTNECTSLG